MSEAAFKYSDAQWAAIVAAAGPLADCLVREDWDAIAEALLWTNRQIIDGKASDQRKAEIAARQMVRASTTSAVVREQLDREIAQHQRYQSKFEGIPGARQPKACREALVREALTTWLELGNRRPGLTNADGDQLGGPAARFVRAIFDPVFGSVEGKSGGPLLLSMYNSTIERMQAEGEFRFYGKMAGQTEGAISHISARRFVITGDGSEANTEPSGDKAHDPPEA